MQHITLRDITTAQNTASLTQGGNLYTYAAHHITLRDITTAQNTAALPQGGNLYTYAAHHIEGHNYSTEYSITTTGWEPIYICSTSH